MIATDEQIRELANSIAVNAEAIAEGRVVGPLSAAVARIADSIDTLALWVREEGSP